MGSDPKGGAPNSRRKDVDRSALRRLPLGELQHRHQDGHGIKRWLRKTPWARRRACEPSNARQYPQSRVPRLHANDTCVQGHSQGQPVTNPIAGKYYDGPVGIEVGRNLADYWKLEDHKLGETTFTHYPDGTAHKNRMQGNDFVQSLMYARGVTCFSCHDPHATKTSRWCAER